MKLVRMLTSLALISACGGAYAFGEINRLPGSQILAAGDIEQVTCPVGGKYDCLTWPNNLYELSMQNICFTADVSCGYSCKGFIAKKNGVNTLYVLGGLSGLASSDLQMFNCPSKF
ncbi:hypothetical protein FXN65_10620 [Metapseudomonas lalkuanensis]|uniref:Secreted protein n=1 Tax=Metapseudomonas lalkuanensis TaxID=2604832 RepID=A0A5J6QJ70_9GAMM|nr:hypothetical protein [Pseudomonas lalkuanensis]QEY62507.1 hypothetical protein FXN65_10620 [Pseudomonas lalkuanensis]